MQHKATHTSAGLENRKYFKCYFIFKAFFSGALKKDIEKNFQY